MAVGVLMITPETFNGGAMAFTGVGDYYLGPGHKRFVVMTPAIAHDIFLPDASQPPMGSGGPIFFVWNESTTRTLTFKDVGGNTIATLAPEKKCRVYLGHSNTANGHWLIHGATKDGGYDPDPPGGGGGHGDWGNGDSGDGGGIGGGPIIDL